MNKSRTIKTPGNNNYISVIEEDEVIKIQLHRYDPEKIYLTLDRKCLPELIKILKDING